MHTAKQVILVLTLLTAFTANADICPVDGLRGKFLGWFFTRTLNYMQPPLESIEGATSGSVTRITGWLKIHVVGTGKACFVKQYEIGVSNTMQFGDYASSEGFVNLFGEPECEEGDIGFAFGIIRASVAAAAYEKGSECLAKVISSVIIDPFHQYSFGDVSVRVSGEAEGDALALCET